MSDDRDDHIFSVLNELIERAQAGQPILLNETLEQYPEIADEVQQLWATIVVAENLSLGGTHISSKNYSETDYAVPPEAPQLPDYWFLSLF